MSTTVELKGPQQLYEDWERAHWAAHDVDLSRDQSDWAELEGLLERRAVARGALLGAQAAAGNLGQAAGSVSAGALFPVQPAAPFWLAGLVLLLGAGVAWITWGRARNAEITATAATLEEEGDD